MEPNTIIILLCIMFIGGLMPSASSLTVLSRTAAAGFSHGVMTSTGIILGDLAFIITALSGLSVLADNTGALFELIKFLGGIYLIWAGTLLWQSDSTTAKNVINTGISLRSSLLTGFFITLGDQKAILFYMGVFPSLVNVSRITTFDAIIIIITSLLSLGCAKLCYAFMGKRIGFISAKENVLKWLNKSTGAVLIAGGSYIMLTT